jgi:cation diffusion facilitator CzcD-associated flavoprotein CzcO
VAIIGAGMSGLCMAVTLRQAGIDTFTIFEKGADVGGTWRDNHYPGLSCDVPAHFYAYTFALNPEWNQRFARGPEIHGYFRDVAARYDLRRSVRFNSEVVEATYDGDVWTIRTDDGESHTFDVVVAATGFLHRMRKPTIPGLDTFRGKAFHSAQWDPTARVDGTRVGVIGTGSTGVQIVTNLATRASQVTQFQRSAQWVIPFPNWTYTPLAKALLRRSASLRRGLNLVHRTLFDVISVALLRPSWQRRMMQGLARGYLHTVRDPDLRAQLTPDYEPLCRRVVISSGYYRAVQRPTVDVVSSPIDHIRPEGVVTEDGRLHELDVIVLATGFDTQAYVRPMAVTGQDGLRLEDAWANGPKAHRTVAIPGFPNFFLIMGPNSPAGNTSLVPVAEAQVGFVMQFIQRLRSGELQSVAAKPDATEAFNTHLRNNMGSTIWVSGCDSWYLGPDGTPMLWPFSPPSFRQMLATPRDDEFELEPMPTSRGVRRVHR